MSPAPLRIHQKISGNLFFEIKKRINGGWCEIFAAPFDVRFPEGEQTDAEILSVVQPDISVICDPDKLDEKGCKGAPDFIAEIISPSTARKDMRDKLLLYEKHKVPVYWVVHPVESIVMVYKLNERRQYGRPEVFSSEDVIELNLKEMIEIKLEAVF